MEKSLHWVWKEVILTFDTVSSIDTTCLCTSSFENPLQGPKASHQTVFWQWWWWAASQSQDRALSLWLMETEGPVKEGHQTMNRVQIFQWLGFKSWSPLIEIPAWWGKKSLTRCITALGINVRKCVCVCVCVCDVCVCRPSKPADVIWWWQSWGVCVQLC